MILKAKNGKISINHIFIINKNQFIYFIYLSKLNESELLQRIEREIDESARKTNITYY